MLGISSGGSASSGSRTSQVEAKSNSALQDHRRILFPLRKTATKNRVNVLAL
jgi:hypothetical protein